MESRGDGRTCPSLRRRVGELPGAVTSGNDNGRVAHAPLVHQCEQRCGIRRMEPDTAMRGRTTEVVDLVAAVDRIAAVEKDRVWHGRVVVLLREPRPFHSLRPVGATPRAIATAAGRNYPSVTRHAVHHSTNPTVLNRRGPGHSDAVQ